MPPSAGAAFGRIHDGATRRRHDVSDGRAFGAIHEEHQAHKGTQRKALWVSSTDCNRWRRRASRGGRS